jgi:hypothetical protein
MQTVDNRSLVLFLSGLAAAGAAVCIAVSCSDQPRPKCASARGTFSATYKQNGGTAAGDCVVKGQIIGVQSYNPPNADRTNADLTKATIAIKGQGLQDAIDEHGGDPEMNAAHNPLSQGPFATSEPGGDNFCNVGQLNPAEQELPFVPAVPPVPPPPDAGPDAEGTPGVPAIPGRHIKYEWSNVKVIVKPTALGTMMVGDLTYTADTTADPDAGPAACSATYRVHAVYPSIDCHKLDADGNPVDPPAKNFCACLPYADPDNGRATGSGMSPDFFGPPGPLGSAPGACELSQANADALENAAKVACDPDTFLCVLKAEPTN